MKFEYNRSGGVHGRLHRPLARNNFLPVLGDPTFPAGGPLAASGSDGHDGRYCGSIYFRRNCTVTIGSAVTSVQLDCDFLHFLNALSHSATAL